MTTFLIVDDHAAFRRQARALLEAEGLVVIGEAHDATSAVEAVRTLRPDIVLLDIGLPWRDGFSVAEELQNEVTPPRVVLISSRDELDYQSRISSSPAAGFVRKDDLSAAALAAVLGGL
jgi:DNA-binding NarL/FixJ family response regulator